MVGPYVASGPLAHSLCLDKVVTKMILRQHGLPTPDFVVLTTPDMELPDITYPMIVKPKNEAVSFGLKIVDNDENLREAARAIYDEFKQPVLAEQYIEGRELNVALLGNNPTDALPPVELQFGDGPRIYTYEDKTHQSGREVTLACPAAVSDDLKARAQDIARQAFSALGCYDCARIDMRLDEAGNLYILEVNSLPGLSERGSYATAASRVCMDYAAFINRLVEVASARYFGVPEPPSVDAGAVDPPSHVASYVTQRRSHSPGDQVGQIRAGPPPRHSGRGPYRPAAGASKVPPSGHRRAGASGPHGTEDAGCSVGVRQAGGAGQTDLTEGPVVCVDQRAEH